MSKVDQRTYFKNTLSYLYDERELDSFYKWLMEDDRSDDVLWVESVIDRLAQEEPIQYILGYTWFYNLKLRVDQSVLIPRQETEELVHWIMSDHAFKTKRAVWDIGTGSGCIALALASYMRAPEVLATDVSAEALKLAEINASLNEVHNVNFKLSDIFSFNPEADRFDIIVSNPPYVKQSDAGRLSKNVIDFEPELALLVPDEDALIFYDTIAETALKCLKPEGKIYFEINEFLKDETCAILKEKGLKNIQARKDLNGLWRMVRAEL